MIIYFNIIFLSTQIFTTPAPVTAAIQYTPYVDLCDYVTARNESRIELFKKNQAHAGFFTVNKKFDTNLFSVYVKSINSSEKTPLIVWIQGQPGISALYAIFAQHGPHHVDEDFRPTERLYAWTKHYDVLYLDNMIFTGYSYSKHPSNIIVYLQDIGRYLYEALFQFYQIFPEVASKHLYLAGEFYSGKYLLLLGNYIHSRNPLSHVKMNLHGIYIGSGFTDPVNMMDYSSLFYQIGIIDYDKMKDINNLESTIVKGIFSKRYDTARQQFDSVWVELFNAGFHSPMDFTRLDLDYDTNVIDFIQSDVFRKTFGLVDHPFHNFFNLSVFLDSRNNTIQLMHLVEEDALKSAVKYLPMLLDHYRILFYGAQFDLMVPYVHVSNFLRKLEWKGAIDYYNMVKSPRNKWYVGDEMAGYWKTVGNLTEVMVRNSGHMIDVSQPKWAINLLRSFISNKFHSASEQVESSTPTVIMDLSRHV
ncbi:venom serine carboxypeptidase-like [Planococcus citri]|uniref:venom serine carboxypeptidase-like n=1 Tax=Planococcus citri TaxID=170843 RepID=UPI0031F87A91